MLTTNDRIIKLWKFDYKVHKESTKCRIGADGGIIMPETRIVDEGYESTEKK